MLLRGLCKNMEENGKVYVCLRRKHRRRFHSARATPWFNSYRAPMIALALHDEDGFCAQTWKIRPTNRIANRKKSPHVHVSKLRPLTKLNCSRGMRFLHGLLEVQPNSGFLVRGSSRGSFYRCFLLGEVFNSCGTLKPVPPQHPGVGAYWIWKNKSAVVTIDTPRRAACRFLLVAGAGLQRNGATWVALFELLKHHRLTKTK